MIYSYSNPTNPSEVVDVSQPVDSEHVFIKDGVKWQRVWYKPQMAVDTKIDIRSSKDFVEKTRNKAGSLGQIMDFSKELSEKREEKDGIDEIKQQHYLDYSKKRKGKHSPEQKKEELQKTMRENKHFDLEE